MHKLVWRARSEIRARIHTHSHKEWFAIALAGFCIMRTYGNAFTSLVHLIVLSFTACTHCFFPSQFFPLHARIRFAVNAFVVFFPVARHRQYPWTELFHQEADGFLIHSVAVAFHLVSMPPEASCHFFLLMDSFAFNRMPMHGAK